MINPTTGKPVGHGARRTVGPQVEAAWSAGRHPPRLRPQAGQLVLDHPSSTGAKPFRLTHAATPATADVNPSFAPTTKALIIAFVQSDRRSAQLCFATIGRFALNSDCTSAPGWDLGGQVAWSPDGSTILVLGTANNGANFGLLAFTSNVPFSTHASRLGPRQLQTNASVAGQGVFAGRVLARWQADGAGLEHRQRGLPSVRRAGWQLFRHRRPKQLPVRACQVSWRSDSQELAVMQPDGLCSPTATGTIVGIDLSDPRRPTILATHGAHPAWQPVPSGG